MREVADVTHLTWPEVFKMPVLEFLNVNCYIRDYNDWQRGEMEKWKRRH